MAQKSAAMLPLVTKRDTRIRSNWLKRILTASDIRKTRLDLSRLSDDQLRDIGLTREQVEREIRRNLWDAPEYFYQRG